MYTKNVLAVLFLLISLLVLEIFNGSKPKHPYAGLDIEDLVGRYGFPLETHSVTTTDGYILTLHRIPHGPEQTSQNRTPVLFLHGFAQSAMDFVNLGPTNALSFLLVNKGYDVWLGNVRGNKFSRNHTFLDSKTEEQYWDFSLHEIGEYDTPAFIDYILANTGHDSLHYIGYSQGTTVFFIMGSEKPQYMKKIKLMTALAPAVFLEDPKGPALSILKHLGRLLEMYFQLFDIRSVFTEDSYISMYLRHICNENSIFVELCLHQIFVFHGYDYDQVNKSELSLIYSNTPAGASPKQLLQINQFMKTGEFQRYDFGVEENLKNYNSEEPPHYNVSRIDAPVALYYSENDFTINEKNINRITSSLPNVAKVYKVGLTDFNHNDFINGKDVSDLLYKAVIEEILKH